MNSKSIFVVGAGSWGTALASVLIDSGNDVYLWFRDEEYSRYVDNTKINIKYLPDFSLSGKIKIVSDLSCASKCSIILLAVPCQFFRAVFVELLPFLTNDITLVSAIKGIEIKSNKTVSQIIRSIVTEFYGESISYNYAAISGPSFAKEVVMRLPTAVTVASDDISTAANVQSIFINSYFRCYTLYDLVGVEIAGALKNVIAIGTGISDGMLCGENSRAALITRGVAEIARLGVRMGANPLTFSGLSGVGDMVLTCTGDLSRNRRVGLKLGRGESLAVIMAEMKMVAEGVATAKSAMELSFEYGVEMPILREVHDVIYNGKSCRDALQSLLSRSSKEEFYF